MAKPNRDIVDFLEFGVDMTTRTLMIGSGGQDEDGGQIGVDWRLADRVLKGLHLLETAAPAGDKPIAIILNNPGGSSVDGMAIYDAIRACKNHVTITVYGEACSMGCVILQAADHRVLAEHAVVMFHDGMEAYADNHPEIVRRWVKFNERFGKKIEAIVTDRIQIKHPDLKGKKLRDMHQFDTILFASEAVELGLADELLITP